MTRFGCYDRDADIVWIPVGESPDVVSERVPGGLRDYDRATRTLVAIEVWDASTRLPASLLEALPAPERERTGAEPHLVRRLPGNLRRMTPEDLKDLGEQTFTGFPPLREDDDIVPVRAEPID